MKFIRYMLGTGAIVAVVWLAVWLQPATALREPEYVDASPEVTPSSQEPQVKSDSVFLEAIELSGIEHTIELEKPDNLWQWFQEHTSLHNSVNTSNPTVYVLYSAFSNDFSKATALIGYDTRQLDGRQVVTGTLVPGQYHRLARSHHKSPSLNDAWNSLDYGRRPMSVLERYQLDDRGNIIDSDMLVIYAAGKD